MRWLLALVLLAGAVSALAQDYERGEALGGPDPARVDGRRCACWIEQTNGHKVLALYTVAQKPRGAAIIAHGRGWSPDFELYGVIRTKLAEQGYSTLSIQLPVLGGGAKIGDYIPTYPDAAERFDLAAKLLQEKGYKNIAIVSHSLGATMANQYLINASQTPIKAWVFIGIINGLEEMFRIKIPVMDIYGSQDWEITQVGAYERKKQIDKVRRSEQVKVRNAKHFFEGQEDELVQIVAGFLDRVFHDGEPATAASR